MDAEAHEAFADLYVRKGKRKRLKRTKITVKRKCFKGLGIGESRSGAGLLSRLACDRIFSLSLYCARRHRKTNGNEALGILDGYTQIQHVSCPWIISPCKLLYISCGGSKIGGDGDSSTCSVTASDV